MAKNLAMKAARARLDMSQKALADAIGAVSYTHLTLPTKSLV